MVQLRLGGEIASFEDPSSSSPTTFTKTLEQLYLATSEYNLASIIKDEKKKAEKSLQSMYLIKRLIELHPRSDELRLVLLLPSIDSESKRSHIDSDRASVHLHPQWNAKRPPTSFGSRSSSRRRNSDVGDVPLSLASFYEVIIFFFAACIILAAVLMIFILVGSPKVPGLGQL